MTNKERLELANNIMGSGFDHSNQYLSGKVSEAESFIDNVDRALKKQNEVFPKEENRKIRAQQGFLSQAMADKYPDIRLDKILAGMSIDEGFDNSQVKSRADAIRKMYGDIKLNKDEAVEIMDGEEYKKYKEGLNKITGKQSSDFELEDAIVKMGGGNEDPSYSFFDDKYNFFRSQVPVAGGVAPTSKKKLLHEYTFYQSILNS